ncbi:hypothetical protein D8X55_02095 [Malacoplasma penetrans]|uniref:Predicted integral membrane protein n=1 Tax=Malacoplasma penetrans (strain HF-2) TaxID=272633 RepID=Q8EVF8_MALP2|nr:hypothetical protein [Malacoplasma penetrans]RXY96937.1 hypothetical protein D8X55_02095 [Malacoplasma penetrans]BAC44396.1 predicted integral membrane protein [Malacoplasma penetrans HF-2]
MKLKNKRSLIKLFSVFLAGATIAIPLSSCSYNNNDFSYDASQTPPKDFNDSTNSDNNNNGSNSFGTLDASIVESKKIESNMVLVEEKPNEYGLTQNYNDFGINGDFSKYLGDKAKIPEDILGYLNHLYYVNNKTVSITNSNLKKVSFTELDSNNKLVFNKTKISFELEAKVSSKELSDFVIGDEKFSLPKDTSLTLTIKADEQILKPTIQKHGQKFYLGWVLDKVFVSFNNKDFEILNFKPTENSFSKAFYFSFNDLSEKQTYFDLKEKYQKDFGQSINSESIKKYLEEKINRETSLYFDYMDLANNLINEIAIDQPVNKLIEKSALYLIDIITKIGIIPDGIDAILKEAITANGSSNSNTLIQVIVNNKNKILSILKSYLGSAYDIVQPLLENLETNMTADNSSYKLIMEYVGQFVGKDDPIRNLITGDILGVTSQAKSLLDILWTNLDTILAKIKEATKNNPTLTSLIDLLTIIFTKDSSANEYGSIYDSMFGSDEAKQKVINAIKNLLPANVGEYIDILFVNNKSFDKTNFQKIIQSFANFFKGLFEYKTESTDKTSFDQRYKNLSFAKTWVNNPVVNKQNNLITTTFKYEVKASISTAVTLDMVPLKNIISQESFNTLINKIANLSGTNASLAESNIYPDLKKYLFNFLPDNFVFGGNGKDTNALIFTYSGDNEEIWFSPEKKGSDYYLGFSVGYGLNIFYDDPNLWKTIASNSNYVKGVFEASKRILLIATAKFKFWYYDFWKSIFQNVLMRSYDINSRFYISDYSTKIADYSSYNPNYYYTNLSFVNNVNNVNVNEIKTMFDLSKAENFKEENSRFTDEQVKDSNTLMWANKDSEVVNGIMPVTNLTNLKTMKDKMFTFSDLNSNFKNLEYGLDYSFNTLFNFSTKLEFQVTVSLVSVDVHPTISLSAGLFKSNLFLPVNFYDVTNKRLVNNFSKNYSDFVFSVSGV